MAPLRSKQRLLFVKTEGASYGVDSSPTGSNALLINDDLQLSPLAGATTQRRVIRNYRGAYESAIVNTQVGITFSVELAGSGAAGTANAVADVLRACATAQTITAAALTGTAAAGAANSITLAVGTSAVNDFYCGQIISISSGAGSGHVGVITGYNGTSKVATVAPITATFIPEASSAYSIAANVSYRPISTTSGVADTSCTFAYNIDGVEHRLLGCRGTATLNATLGEFGTLNFTMMGIYTSPTDTSQSNYTVAYANQAVPLVYRADNVRATRFFGYAGCFESINMDFGNEVSYRELIGCSKEVAIPDGQTSGTVMMEATSIAAFDPFTRALSDGTYGALSSVIYGAAGNRVSLVIPRCDLGQPSYTTQNGYEMLNLPFTAIPSATGNDDFYLVYG
jgi:hypothetical protein